MSEQGAALQSYNQELVKYIEHLKVQREKLNDIIKKQESEKRKTLKEIEQLNNKLSNLNESLSEKVESRDAVDRTLLEAENGLKKILESSQILLSLVQKEANTLKF